jgi:thiamine biosynthesis protein ThiS
MVEITVNGTARQLEGSSTLLDLLKGMKMEKRLLLIRLNGSIISRTKWSETTIRDKDSIDIEHVIQAGG